MKQKKLKNEKLIKNKKFKRKCISSKILYNQKYSKPLKRKHRNEYDPKEEARYDCNDNIINFLNNSHNLYYYSYIG